MLSEDGQFRDEVCEVRVYGADGRCSLSDEHVAVSLSAMFEEPLFAEYDGWVSPAEETSVYEVLCYVRDLVYGGYDIAVDGDGISFVGLAESGSGRW